MRWTGHRARFEEAALRHLEALYRFTVYLCRNDNDAEDLLQDTLLNAFRKYHQFRPGTNLKAWLFRIARNAHIDRGRKRQREPELNELKEAVAPVSQGLDGSDGALESWKDLTRQNKDAFLDLFGDEVNRFLNELPAEFRLAVVLCDVEGLSYQEIGEALDCPVGTVRSRISRARVHLREKLEGYAAELGLLRSQERGAGKSGAEKPGAGKLGAEKPGAEADAQARRSTL